MNTTQQQTNNAELNVVAKAYYEVEYRKKEFFFSTSATRQRTVEEAHLNPSILLLSSLLGYCRFSDNNALTLTANLISQINLSPILKETESHYQS